MKKYLICLISLVLCLFVFFGCERATQNKFSACISENTFGLASSSDGKFKVDYKWGKRENPYASDGKTSPLIEYGVITATSLTGKLKNHTASYSILIDNKQYEGDFLVNPYDQTFVIDLRFIPTQTTDFEIEIINDDVAFAYTLQNVLGEGDATCDEVVSIAYNALKNSISTRLAEGETYEIYVRLVNSQNKDFKPCWYVSVYTTKNQLFAVAVDPNTRIVLARKI